MGSNTPRLGLYKPNEVGETVDVKTQINNNYDQIDRVAGCLLVANGYTPPNTDLFDGCIVREKTSGKVWMAQKNVTGGFDQLWLSYPWFAVANFNVPTVPSDLTPRRIGLASISASESWNAPASTLVGTGNLQIPVKGLYQVTVHCNWGNNGTGNRYIRPLDSDNFADDLLSVSIMTAVVGNSTIQTITTSKILQAGQLLSIAMWQTSGVNLAPSGKIKYMLIQALDS